MRYVYINKSSGVTRIIRCYETPRSKNNVAIQIDGKTYYMGAGNSNNGPVVMRYRKNGATYDICEWADDVPAKTAAATYTASTSVTLDPADYPLGFYIEYYGGKGNNAYGSGGNGSGGSIAKGQFYSSKNVKIEIGVVGNGSSGSAGTAASSLYQYSCSGKSCTGTSIASSGGSGGSGGKGTRVIVDGSSYVGYGGGGGGGSRGHTHSTATYCTKGGTYDSSCKLSGSDDKYGRYGSGGAAGNGTGGSGVNGGSAGSYTGSAKVVIYKFIE